MTEEKKALFTVYEENLDTGLRGYPVGYCPTSYVDPMKGLFYRDKPVTSLVQESEEKVMYLLYYGKEPNATELTQFTNELRKRCTLPQEVITAIEKLPQKAAPMTLFSMALELLGVEILQNDWREDCLNIMAKIPALSATVINYHAGWGRGALADPHLGYTENFLKMLNLHEYTPELFEVMRLFILLHFDHGGGNLSTFVGKAVASSLSHIFTSLAAAMNALAGPKHGMANQECLQFTQNLLEELGEGATEEKLEALLRKRLANKELLYGFGHAVLRVEDPRATLFYQLGEKKFSHHPLMKMALLLRKVGSKVLAENPKVSDPYTNVDAISGAILSAAGFPYPDYFTLLFGTSRCVGIAIQIVYERCIAREGKGTPIVRPRYLYKH